jgi:hypothetical protein
LVLNHIVLRNKILFFTALATVFLICAPVIFAILTFPNVINNLGNFREISSVGIENSKSILGFASDKKYLLVFQNSAEARGTGGIIGAYAVVNFHKGVLTVERKGSNAELQHSSKLPIDLGSEYFDLYGNDPAIWQNSNESPHFPYGAKIWLSLWKKQSGQTLDGVISVDPEAISYVLSILGPVTLPSGEIINSANVVEKTLSTSYVRFAQENNKRKDFLVEIMSLVLNKLSRTNTLEKLKVANALMNPYTQHRLLFYSTNPTTQAAIEKTQFGGVLSNSINNEFRVVILNTSGNKMDYYLDKNISLRSMTCSKERKTKLVATLTNAYDGIKALPNYVWGRLDVNKPEGLGGSYGFYAFVYGPTNATLFTLDIDKEVDALLAITQERDRPLALIKVDLAPQGSEKITAVFLGGKGELTYHRQPSVRPDRVKIQDNC